MSSYPCEMCGKMLPKGVGKYSDMLTPPVFVCPRCEKLLGEKIAEFLIQQNNET